MPTGNALQGHLWNMVALRTGGVEHHINTEKERKKNFEDNITISFWRHPECKKWECVLCNKLGISLLTAWIYWGTKIEAGDTGCYLVVGPLLLSMFISSFHSTPLWMNISTLVAFLPLFCGNFHCGWWSTLQVSYRTHANGRPQSSHLAHIRPGSSLGANCQTCVTWKVLHRY